jgi:hypothetical protein
MTKRNDFIGDLEDYLVDFDGETPLPERVRDALDAELQATRQVRPGAGRRKGPTMSSSTPNIARWGLVAAGLVVAVGLGAAIVLPGRGGGGGAAVASPTPIPSLTPTPAPTTVPSASAGSGLRTLQGAPYESCEVKPAITCMVPGTYLLGMAAPGGTIDVPAGWWEWNPGAGSVGMLVEHPDAAGGSGWGLVLMQVGDVRRDPCDRTAGTFASEDVDTPAKLAAVMATWPGFESTSPQPIQVGGVEGVQVRLTTTLDPADCMISMLWETPMNTAIDAYPMLSEAGIDPGAVHPADFRIIELDGQLVAIRTMPSARTSPHERSQGIADDPTRHAADVVAQEAMIDSIRFGVTAP